MPTLQILPTRCKTPVVKLTIKGLDYFFIVDTGATHTIIEVDLADSFKYDFASARAGKMTGVGQDRPVVLRVGLTFNFLNVSINPIVISNRMKQLKLDLPVEVSGLIGQDILSQFKQVIFDYSRQTVSFIS
jgi:hypothetical protein